MNKTCARCQKVVYPIEELKCLDKVRNLYMCVFIVPILICYNLFLFDSLRFSLTYTHLEFLLCDFFLFLLILRFFFFFFFVLIYKIIKCMYGCVHIVIYYEDLSPIENSLFFLTSMIVWNLLSFLFIFIRVARL